MDGWMDGQSTKTLPRLNTKKSRLQITMTRPYSHHEPAVRRNVRIRLTVTQSREPPRQVKEDGDGHRQ